MNFIKIMKLRMLFFFSSVLLALFLIFLVVISNNQKSIITKSYKLPYGIINTLFPQGWGFFTKDPRDNMLTVYLLRNNELIEFNCKNTQLKYLYGIKKQNRKILSSLKQELNNLPSNLWFPYNENIFELDVSYLNTVSFKKEKGLLPKGKYVISISKPIPWVVFSNKENQLKIRSSNIILNVD